MRQDDPRKCTAAKLVKFRLATPIYKTRQVPAKAIVLNPFAESVLLPHDREAIIKFGLVAVDCSWEKAGTGFPARLPGSSRRLPTLLAANPVNYAKQHKLSSVEALAAALYLTGFNHQAEQLLGLFKWGHTFSSLNSEPLKAYLSATNSNELAEIEQSFF